ncbi:hypothetical protein CASFOL_017388 [Castilleja foliolosa]|uniref:Uncharacterized protein n=1 Tax=Castilleja foliolosa TaxID=1961234 RepID=A0ABD3DD20_9LAMI
MAATVVQRRRLQIGLSGNIELGGSSIFALSAVNSGE